jgi:large subunit ribosomal protein L9
MKVILLQDIDKIGKKYDVKEVKDGYARNFLFPKKLVKEATEEAIKWIEMQKEIEAKKSEEVLQKFQEVASSIDGREVMVSMKVGKEGQLFESVSAQLVSEKLKEAGFDIKKTQIIIDTPIKDVGEFPVKIKFDHNLESEIKVIVTEEIKEEKEEE